MQDMPTASPGSQFDASEVDLEGFLAELKMLRAEIDASLGEEDIAHLRKIERLGRLATALGMATCWIAPNPLSAAALSTGRMTRWLLMHHIAHRGYDRVPGIPRRYTSKVFARGARRFLDFVDWLTPESWVHVHHRHHSYTGEMHDPDLFEERTERLRTSGYSMRTRYALVGLRFFSWRFTSYAPNAVRGWLVSVQEKEARQRPADAASSAPRAVGARDLWLRSYLPNGVWYFGLLPAAFLPLGPWAAASALLNSIGAELLMNAHAFLVTLPNHTGDDVYRFSTAPASKGEWILRQIVGTSNYTGGGTDLSDVVLMFLNYHIEHHIWPDLPMLRIRQVQPKVKALCAKYGVPYVEETVFTRVRKAIDIAVGKTKMWRSPGLSSRAAAHAAE